MILIDEAGRPILYANHYGYEKEFRKFYDRFLEIDHYEQDFGIVTTSFAPANTDVDYDLKFIHDVPVNEVIPLRKVCEQNDIGIQTDYEPTYYFSGMKYFHVSVNLEACFDAMIEQEGEIRENNSYVIKIGERESNLIRRKRSWIEECKVKKEIEDKRRREQSRVEYAASLPEDCHIPSAFAGTREFHLIVTNHERLNQLNGLLIDLYDRFGSTINQRDAYQVIQKYSDDDKEAKIDYQMEELIQQSQIDPSWNIRVETDSYWERFDCDRGDKYQHNDLTLVKAYLSLPDMREIRRVFRNVVQFLLFQGKERFHAKAARQSRDDQICLWVTREDFFRLEEYIANDTAEYIQPLPFIAYRGRMGISRELYTWDSHNGIQASLISAYLSEVQDRKEISLIDMYQKYVAAWNGDLNEESKITKDFKESNAQEFIILLESINCILGDGKIANEHILLSDNSKLWHVLGESKNWYEVGQHYRRDD